MPRKATRVRSVMVLVMNSMIGRMIKRADRQRQIEQEHGHHDAAQRQDVGGELNQAVGKNLIDGLAVVADAAHQIAGAVAVVIIHRERLKVAEERHADIGDKMLAHANHDDAVQRGEDALRQIHCDHDHDDAEQPVDVMVDHVLVDGAPQQRWTDQAQDGREHHQQGDKQQAAVVGLEIIREAAQRTAPVLGFFAGGASAAVPADEARTGV